MAVELRKDDGGERPSSHAPSLPDPAPGSVPPPAGSGATAARASDAARWELPAPLVRTVRTGWPALWILMFASDHWHAGLLLLFSTGPVMAVVRGRRGSPRRRRDRDRRRRELRERYDRRVLEHREQWRGGVGALGGHLQGPGRPVRVFPPAPAPPPAPVGSTTSTAEHRLAATLLRAETSGSRMDPDAVALVREVEELLRPLLAAVRARGTDARVRHDVEAIATEHLPGALDAYLVLPADYAHGHRTASGTTAADELRSQLTLLVEGCRQLRDAVHSADLDRQQQLSRFLDAKYRRSDLDL